MPTKFSPNSFTEFCPRKLAALLPQSFSHPRPKKSRPKFTVATAILRCDFCAAKVLTQIFCLRGSRKVVREKQSYQKLKRLNWERGMCILLPIPAILGKFGAQFAQRALVNAPFSKFLMYSDPGPKQAILVPQRV